MLNNATIAAAESCTGGLLAQRLTSIAGSSSYFLGGVVCYSNELKTAWADVPAEIIAAKGAVSPEVAVALAEGIRRRVGSTLGVGITGIAGPSGGSDGFFVGAPARPRDSGDAHTKRAAHAAANTFGERHRDFRAHRAFGGNNLRGHIGPGGLEFIAVAHHAAEKIRGAAGDAGEPLREQAAGAAFRCGDGRIVERELLRDDFFERAAVLAKNAVAERYLEALHDFVQRFLGALAAFAPQTPLNF